MIIRKNKYKLENKKLYDLNNNKEIKKVVKKVKKKKVKEVTEDGSRTI